MDDELTQRDAPTPADSNVINPRLIDPFGLAFTQDEVPFAIPHLRDDLPLYLDPFLLWKSDREDFHALHEQLLAFFDLVRLSELDGQRSRGRNLLLGCSEAVELGLGYGRGSKRGTAIGPGLAGSILEMYAAIPQLGATGLTHIEVLGLVVPNIAEDRISDLTASVLKRFFIDFTREQATTIGIPMKAFHVDGLWDASRRVWHHTQADLPYNPLDGAPLLFAPLDLLRHLPWINYEDYYKSSYARLVPPAQRNRRVPKAAVLEHNRQNFRTVETYVDHKERTAAACAPDPLFQPLKRETLRKKLADLRKLPTGRDDGSDRKFEQVAYELLASLLYPELEFADSQVRTVSGAHIRDIIFYNDGKTEFLADMRTRYGARQVVFELKNTNRITGEHVNQLYRYLDEEIGHFGVLLTRHAAASPVKRNIIDLHSSKRCIILVLDDTDLELMLDLVDSGRRPADAIKKRYVELARQFPK